MKIHVQYDKTDIALMIGQIIKHENKEELVKLLTPILCENNNSITLFSQLCIGKKLPNVIPNGSLCYVPVGKKGHLNDKMNNLLDLNKDTEDRLIGTINHFNGYHIDQYKVDFKFIDEHGDYHIDYSYIYSEYLEPIQEF